MLISENLVLDPQQTKNLHFKEKAVMHPCLEYLLKDCNDEPGYFFSNRKSLLLILLNLENHHLCHQTITMVDLRQNF